MSHFLDDVQSFLRDHSDPVEAGLALIVLFEAAIIWLWARRARGLARRLHAAEDEIAEAAVELADAMEDAGLEDGEDGARRTIYRVTAATTSPSSTAAPVEQPAPATPVAEAVPQVAAPLENTAEVAAAALPESPEVAPLVADDAVRDTRALAAASWASAAEEEEAPVEEPAAAWLQGGDPVPAAAEDAAGGAAPWLAGADAEPVLEVAPVAEVQPAPWVPTQTWTLDTAETAHVANGSTPVEASTAATEGAAASPPRPTRHEGEGDLLLVEDDENVARLYRMLLEGRGYSVRHASDGVEGIDEARRQRPDLILLDVMMPRMNGIMFLQALRSSDSGQDVPVVVLSNFREPRLVERALSLGALEYMVKAQTRPEVLVGAIPHWIRGERAFTR